MFFDINCDNLNLPNNPSEIIFVTNNFDFTSSNNMEKLYYANKKLTSRVGGAENIYYVSTIENDYDFDVYFIPKDEEGNYLDHIKISKTSYLTDITGKRIRMEVNGKMYDLKIKYLMPIYESPPDGLYYLDES